MKIPDLDNQSIDRIVEMAWEDRTPFEAMKAQFGLQDVSQKMSLRSEIENYLVGSCLDLPRKTL